MIKNLFRKKEKKDHARDVRELLRENLELYPVDMFYLDDPMNKLTPEKKVLYLKKFADVYTNKIFMERIRYQINRQAQKTLANSKDGVQDIAGAMTINGLAFVLDEIERLANLYILETTKPKETPMDKFKIIPTMES